MMLASVHKMPYAYFFDYGGEGAMCVVASEKFVYQYEIKAIPLFKV